MINVSVIVPVYKVPLEYLRECFDSLLAQTMQECEFIVASDGAPEAECSVCEEYATKDPRFKFFRREHAGVSATRNFGIEQAQGEYITFVDSDDWIAASCCKDIFSYAKKNLSDIVFWNLNFSESQAISSTTFFPSDIDNLSEEQKTLFRKRCIYAPSKEFLTPCLSVCKLYRTDLIKKNNIRFNSALQFGEDRVFSYQIALIAPKYSYLNKAYYFYRMHSQSTMHVFQKKTFEKHLQYINELRKIGDKADKDCIANETICSYYGCIAKIYTSKISYKEKLDELQFLKRFIKKEMFCDLIQKNNTNLGKCLFGLEIFLMKHKISWLFSLRILKFKIFSLLNRKHQS